MTDQAGGRPDGRAHDELRPVVIETGVQEYAEGSVLISMGKTRVLCSATLETGVPRWRMGSGKGWVTAEYSMLPRATSERTQREATRGRLGGRTQEIQRLIGRALRSAIDLKSLGEHSIIVDCDVLQADGGTRTASITGGWVALSLAVDSLVSRGLRKRRPELRPVSAISVGIVAGRPLLDLCYVEDSAADVDMNVVMAGDGRFIELQGTAEQDPFSREMADAMLDLATAGCTQLFDHQRRAATAEA